MALSDRSQLTRRDVLRLALASPTLVAGRLRAIGASASLATPSLDRASLVSSPSLVVAAEGNRADGIELVRDWKGRFCRSRVVSHRRDAIRVKEIVLFEVPLAL